MTSLETRLSDDVQPLCLIHPVQCALDLAATVVMRGRNPIQTLPCKLGPVVLPVHHLSHAPVIVALGERRKDGHAGRVVRRREEEGWACREGSEEEREEGWACREGSEEERGRKDGHAGRVVRRREEEGWACREGSEEERGGRMGMQGG